MLFASIKKLKNYSSLLEKIKEKKFPLSLEGLWGSSKSLLISSLFRDLKIPSLIISENVEEAEKFFSDLITFLGEERVSLFPFQEVLPSEKLKPPASILRERLKVLEKLGKGESLTIIAPIQAVLPKIISPLNLKRNRISLTVGDSLNREALVKKFLNIGYEPSEIVEEKSSFVVRAGIIDIFPSTLPLPARIELSGEKIASLRLFDPGTQRTIRKIDNCEILPKDELNFGKNEPVPFLEYLPEKSIIFLNEPKKMEGEARKYLEKVPREKRDSYLFWDELSSLLEKKFLLYLSAFPKNSEDRGTIHFSTNSVEGIKAANLLSRGERIKGRVEIFFTNKGQKERFGQLLKERKIPKKRLSLSIGNISSGFSLPEIPLTLLTDHEIFSRYQSRRPRAVFKEATPIPDFDDLKKGDYIVHINEGIGRFLGLKEMKVDKKRQVFIAIEYAKRARLYLPLSHITLIQKYVGSAKPPKLSHLGTRTWLKTKEKIANRLRDLASDLLELYIYRKRKEGFPFSPDTDWQKELEDAFIYEETPDQERAIKKVKADMETPRPMDRLLCGDVGYGKTEVAMRASFKAVMDSKQVAVLVPTTILATQHLATFKERFAAYPVNIDILSRFKTKAEQKSIVEEFKKGRIDIIIGTHRLLGEDISFYNLGLLIIDEEQRFGVVHKEKLRALCKNIDVLTLSATPIPRTLHLSLSGVRDLSQINTPPEERLPVITYCAEYNESLIREAVLREIERGGQVYYLHNRVYNIEEKALGLRRLLPEAKIGIAHGQLSGKKLEEVMPRFIKGEIDLLLATTIIESGLDIPNVNTIIIEEAENFGLADLYQLRGRVGRYKRRAYAYLFISKDSIPTSEAKKRLKAIEEFSTLGSGFRLAIRDLEIRGAGNILGKEQHGFIEAVGFHLYCDLLQETTGELLGKSSPRRTLQPAIESNVNIQQTTSYPSCHSRVNGNPSLLDSCFRRNDTVFTEDLQSNGCIPKSYIPSEPIRLRLYRRLFSLKREEIPEFTQELKDRFGAIPEPLQKLLSAPGEI